MSGRSPKKKPPYTLKVEERPGYLYARISGKKDSLELTWGAVTELATVCRLRKASKLLVEHRVPGELSTADIVKMACELPDLYRGIFVAFVVQRTNVLDHPQLLEELTRRQGATGRLFPGVAEAERWLASV